MAISKEQPMRPALIDVVDANSALESAIGETNTVVAQLSNELGIEIERSKAEDSRLLSAINTETQRATAAEQANANAIQTETQRATAAEQANAAAISAETQRATAAEQANADAISAIPAFEYGAQENIEVLAGDSTSFTVAFSSEKTSTPYILASVQTEEVENTANCYVIITGVTAIGFTGRVVNADTLNTIEATVYWLAIGE